MSFFVTLPSLPLPGTWLISIPLTFAKCLTAGVAKALLPGGAVAPLFILLVCADCDAGIAASTSCFLGVSAAGDEVDADSLALSSDSISRRAWPTAHMSST